MSCIAELEKKYPTLPQDVIIKWEMMVMGMRDSRDLDKASVWSPASQASYLSYDEEFTLARLKAETPWRVRENAVLMPDKLYMKTGLGFNLYRKERSPYVIREVSEGRFGIFEGEDEVVYDGLHAAPPKERPAASRVTSKGTPVQDLVGLNRHCYRILPVRFCEYFVDGEECKFCNFNHMQEDARSIGLSRPVTINPDETAEAFKIYGSELRLLEGFLESGGFKKTDTEASINCKFVEKLNNALSYRTYMKLVGEAMPRKELLRLRDAGLSGIKLQMEVFDERLFPVINPGKAKHMSREEWLEAFQDAVEIFGVGNVGGKAIGGVTLQGPEGFPTWQEARDSHMEGDKWMISHGVFPAMDALRWAPGSPYSKDPANRAKFAPTEYYLDLIVAHHAAMKEFGLYDKLNKFLNCGLDSVTRVYSGEAGILERAGDVGTWMSDVVPYEHNWLAQFLDSLKTPEEKSQ